MIETGERNNPQIAKEVEHGAEVSHSLGQESYRADSSERPQAEDTSTWHRHHGFDVCWLGDGA